jgi:hypothetical protein
MLRTNRARVHVRLRAVDVPEPSFSAVLVDTPEILEGGSDGQAVSNHILEEDAKLLRSVTTDGSRRREKAEKG